MAVSTVIPGLGYLCMKQPAQDAELSSGMFKSLVRDDLKIQRSVTSLRQPHLYVYSPTEDILVWSLVA